MKAILSRLTHLTGDPLTAGDAPLLDAFLTGDESAFAVLVRRHAGLVFATCRRVLRHQQDAEDAFQATFLVLARRAADVWPREAVASWLFGVAHRVALKARAVRSRRAARVQPLEEVAGPDRPAADFDLAEAVHRVVGRLPEVYRAAVVACDLEGLSRKEAAERLGWPEGTLSGRLARARELLANRLRRAGLSLPAGGLGAVFATNEVASAESLRATIDLATGRAGTASAPVAALTEGVVRSMALFKFKAMAAAVFTAGAIGFGAFAATGTGGPAGAGPGEPTVPVAARPVAPPPKALSEPPVKPVSDRDRFQGTWRIVALTEGGKTTPTNPKDPWVMEVSGGTLRMPYLETEGGWKRREYTFALDPGKQKPDSIEHPSTIDLIAPRVPVGKGIYQFTAPVGTCTDCHSRTNTVGAIQLGFVKERDAIGVCGPGLASGDLGLRLALSIDGKRPTKFGGAGVIVFDLRRPDPEDDERAKLAEAQKRLIARLAAVVAAEEKKRLEAELDALRLRLDELVTREAAVRKATVELRQAEIVLERARVQALAAQAEVDRATAGLRQAQDRLAAAEKAAEDAKNPRPGGAPVGGAAFTVHVRTLTMSEKVIRVTATGKETVLEGLVFAADDVPIKSDGVNVWVVRDGAVLPVDLPAITKKGESKTNYVLKPGDQLFVQAKVGK